MKISKLAKKILGGFLLFVVVVNIISCAVSSFNTKEGLEGRKELLLLHMEKCPHCVTLMPEWEKFCTNNDTSITTRMVENDEDPSLSKKYGVNGFPAILLLDDKGNKIDTYEGDRNAQGLLDFCRQKS
uniref:Thioredoxin domain-containing protein n=1 Tax=viral metagenome TaxID=1070528 RepID=A0A6C0C5X9_9ZZZZ